MRQSSSHIFVKASDIEFVLHLGVHKTATTYLQALFAGKPTGTEDVKRVGNRFSHEKGFEPFSPWTAEESSLLAGRYEMDIARIQERWPDIMIA